VAREPVDDVIWNFACDMNLALAPLQTFVVFEVVRRQEDANDWWLSPAHGVPRPGSIQSLAEGL
jgi:hypothetical protein